MIIILFLIILFWHLLAGPQEKIVKGTGRSLLIGISSTATDFQRRHILRTVQIEPYKDFDITWKFILGRPLPLYEKAIEAEQKLHGDLVILWDMEDTRENARSVKPFEFFKYVEKYMTFHNYVAKMDDDTYMNIPVFWSKFFTPEIRQSKKGVIARIWDFDTCNFPEGGFEAIAWDLMTAINRIYDPNKRDHVEEDMQIGRYFCNHNIPITNYDMEFDSAFHFEPFVYDKTKVCHNVFPDSVRIHKLTTEQDYLMIASCYTGHGFDAKQFEHLKSLNWYKDPDYRNCH